MRYKPIPLEEIKAAQKRITQDITKTPIVKLNLVTQAEIYLKLENLQPIRSFKARPASNVLRQMKHEELEKGVWTVSAGNFSQGLASIAKKLGVKCTVYLSEDTAKTKIEKTEQLGAKVVKLPNIECQQIYVTRTYPGAEGTFVHPSADPAVMAGDGTIGLEIMEEIPDADVVVVPWGIGGLICGIASAVKAINSDVKVYGVQIETNSGVARAFNAGLPTIETWKHMGIPDVYELARMLIDGMLVVSEREVEDSTRLLVEKNCLVAEERGASTVAAALSGKAGYGKIVCVISGGNIDRSHLVKILQEEPHTK